MGAHYRSIQIKSEDRDAVLAVANKLIEATKVRLLIGPAINGWIGIYVNDEPEARNFVTNFAEGLKACVLDVMVHDSDIFYYNFYQEGRLIDEYSSRPDYFEEVSPAEHERLKGKPSVFRNLVESENKLKDIEFILGTNNEETLVFEENRLEKFAELLGIVNTLTSYKYLTQGDWDGIERRKDFTHIPDLTAERQAARKAAAAIRAELKRFKKEGILCFESLQPRIWGHLVSLAAFDPLNGGLLFNWSGHIGDPAEPKLFRIKPPWESKPETVKTLPTPKFPSHLVFSQTGKWFAYFDDELRLWNWQKRNLLKGVDLRSMPLQFSADERRLLCQNGKNFEVFSLDTGKIILKTSTGRVSDQFLAWHPEGRFLVIRPAQEQLGLVDLETGKLVKTLYFGTITDHSNLAPLFSGELKKAGISDAQIAEWKQGFIRGSDMPFSLEFSPDGKLLFCATSRGLRVLEWDKVLNADKMTPVPLIATSPFPHDVVDQAVGPMKYLNYTYDIVYDHSANRLLSCGTEGTVRFFNLNDKSSGILLKPPGNDRICRIQMSPDREFICCHCIPQPDGKREKPRRIFVWNYRLLRAAAGLN